MKPFLLVLIAFCLLCLTGSAQQEHQATAKEKLEALAIKKVKEVPEVKEFLRRGKRSLMIDDEPQVGFKYYVVKMGYDGSMFLTLERFCVDPKTLKVYYWDVMADDAGFSNSAIISLAKWRKLSKTPLWKKPHTYKAGKLVALAN
jgi:hypothetical protein